MTHPLARNLSRPLALIPLLLAAPMAQAQATPEGAATLTALFQTYLGSTPGVVNVTAEGDFYAVTLDASPLLARIPAEAQVTASVSPLQMQVTDNGDGTWDVVQDQPFTLAFKGADEIDMTLSIESISCEGTFDAALMSYVENACDLGGLSLNQVINDPLSGRMETSYGAESGTYQSKAVAAETGGVNATYTLNWSNVTQAMTMPPMGEGMPGQPITITMAEYNTEGTGAGVRPGAFYDLVAWFVAHPDQAAFEASKAELGPILQSGMPFFDRVGGTVRIADLEVGTPVGLVGIDTVNVDIEMTGAVESGLFREAFVLSGITPPEGVLPPWAEELLPDDLSLDFTVTRFNLAETVGLLIGLLDLPAGQEPPEGFDMQVLAALLPEGVVDVTLAPATVGNDMWRINYEGAMTAGPAAMPAGKARVTATGLGEVMAALDEAPQEVKDQALPVLGAAQGLAQQGPNGELVWEIDATEPGTLKVNGMDMMGMQ